MADPDMVVNSKVKTGKKVVTPSETAKTEEKKPVTPVIPQKEEEKKEDDGEFMIISRSKKLNPSTTPIKVSRV